MKNNENYRKAKMANLLQNTNEAFYWIGFLVADGTFSKRYEVKLYLSNKDIEQLYRYGKFIETKNMYLDLKKDCSSVSMRNMDVFDELCSKFNIFNSKTYNPMDFIIFDKFDKELIFSFIVGFIDGDGCIRKVHNRKDCNLQIHLHKFWLNNLIYIENFLYKYFSIEKYKTLSKITNAGYSLLTISNSNILGKMKKEVTKLQLPVLNRKWNVIDENFVSRYKISEINENKVIELYKNNLSPIQIMETLNLKKGVVYKYISKFKKTLS